MFSLVVTAYNEGEMLVETLKKIPKQTSEIIVIDDCSKNNTFELAEQYSKKDKRIKLLRNKINMGKGYSMRRAAAHAAQEKIVFMDATQFNPKDILKMAPKIKKSVIVIGARDFSKVPFFRQFSNYLSKVALFLATGIWVRDSLSGFRGIMKSDFIKLRTKENRYPIEAEICYKALKNKMKIDYVPVSVHYNAPSGIMNPKSILDISIFLFKAIFRLV